MFQQKITIYTASYIIMIFLMQYVNINYMIWWQLGQMLGVSSSEHE